VAELEWAFADSQAECTASIIKAEATTAKLQAEAATAKLQAEAATAKLQAEIKQLQRNAESTAPAPAERPRLASAVDSATSWPPIAAKPSSPTRRDSTAPIASAASLAPAFATRPPSGSVSERAQLFLGDNGRVVSPRLVSPRMLLDNTGANAELGTSPSVSPEPTGKNSGSNLRSMLKPVPAHKPATTASATNSGESCTLPAIAPKPVVAAKPANGSSAVADLAEGTISSVQPQLNRPEESFLQRATTITTNKPTSSNIKRSLSLNPRTRVKPTMPGAEPNNDVCIVCAKRVYLTERLVEDGRLYHKTCFKCEQCKKTLVPGGFAALDGRLFCKPHFKQLFALKGNYNEGFGTQQHKHKWTHKDLEEDSAA
jgi:hypothetical protein